MRDGYNLTQSRARLGETKFRRTVPAREKNLLSQFSARLFPLPRTHPPSPPHPPHAPSSEARGTLHPLGICLHPIPASYFGRHSLRGERVAWLAAQFRGPRSAHRAAATPASTSRAALSGTHLHFPSSPPPSSDAVARLVLPRRARFTADHVLTVALAAQALRCRPCSTDLRYSESIYTTLPSTRSAPWSTLRPQPALPPIYATSPLRERCITP